MSPMPVAPSPAVAPGISGMPVVTPEGRIDVAVRIRLRVTVSEALALGAYRDPSVQAPWESTPSLLRTFRRDRQLIVDRLEQQRGDD